MRFARPVGLVVLLLAFSLPVPAAPQACELARADRQWVQHALDAWERATREILFLDPEPLPWMVLFGPSCVWHLGPARGWAGDAQPVSVSLTFAGRPVPVFARPHQGTVRLPGGREIAARPVANGSLYEDGEKEVPFFVLALPAIWRTIPQAAAEADLESFLLGVATHEMVHTRQLVHVNRRVARLEERYEMPEDISDDIVQERFQQVPGFRAAYREERDLFYRAAQQADPERRRSLVAEALSRVEQRRTRYFTGDNAFFADLENLFLNMEGVAVWTHYKVAQADPAVAFKRRENGYWTQEEGFALFLLLDQMVADWRRRVLSPEMPSPFALLEEALRRDHTRSGSARLTGGR